MVAKSTKGLLVLSSVLAGLVFGVTASWPMLANIIFPDTKIGLYDRSFWEDFLVGLHGVVFELFAIALILAFLDARRQKEGEIRQLSERLEDYASLDSPEFNVSKVGCIKRLISLGVVKFSVRDLVLNRVVMKGISIQDSMLVGLRLKGGRVVDGGFLNCELRAASFENSVLKNATLRRCGIINGKFSKAKCKGADFYGSRLENADFNGADLQGADFRECDVSQANFEGANLKQANFAGAKNLSAKLLSKAGNVDHVKVSQEIVDELITLVPDMKHNLKGIRPRGN